MRRNEHNRRRVKQNNAVETSKSIDQNIISELKPTKKKNSKDNMLSKRIRFIPFQMFNVASVVVLVGLAVTLLMLAASSVDSNASINTMLGPNFAEFAFWVFATLGFSLPFVSYFLVKNNDVSA